MTDNELKLTKHRADAKLPTPGVPVFALDTKGRKVVAARFESAHQKSVYKWAIVFQDKACGVVDVEFWFEEV